MGPKLDRITWSMLYSSMFQLSLASIYYERNVTSLAFLFLLYIRSRIASLYVRLALTAIMISMTIYTINIWFIPLIIIEIIRATLLYVPYLLQNSNLTSVINNHVVQGIMVTFYKICKIPITWDGIVQLILNFITNPIEAQFTDDQVIYLVDTIRSIVNAPIVLADDAIGMYVTGGILLFNKKPKIIIGQHSVILNDQSECPICHLTVDDPYIKLDCDHKFCITCVTRWFSIGSDCPLCRNPLT